MGRIVIELTDRCNLRCRHCPSGRHGGKGELSIAILEEILREAKSLRFDDLAFTGGEPTTHKRFLEVIAKTAEAGYKLGFVTNGWNFKKIYTRLLPYRDRLAAITFSLDGALEATHDALRGRGSYRRVMQALSLCMVRDLPFTLNMVLTRHNHHEVEQMVSTAARLGSRGVRFGPLMPIDKPDREDLALSLQERRAVEARIRRLQQTAPIPVAVAPGYYTTELFPCAPLNRQEFNIDWRGNVTQCCHLSGYGDATDNNDIVGNLNEIDLCEAIARLRRLTTKFCHHKQAHHDSASWTDDDYFPCLYCARHFEKPTNARAKS